MDNLVFEEAVNAETDQSEFISKKWLYVNDSNSQNYTSQVVIDSTPLANSGGYINWSEGYIAMPLVVELTSAVSGSLPVGSNIADHTWAFKNGFWQMINSMTLEFNNQNVVQQTPFLNVFRSFKALTSFSMEDVLNEGYTTGFSPDNPSSWTFNSSPTNTSPIATNGVGLCNNRQVPYLAANSSIIGADISGNLTTSTPFYLTTAFAGQSSTVQGTGVSNPNVVMGSHYSHNQGFAERTEFNGYDPSLNAMGQGTINPANTCSATYRAYKLPQTTAGQVGWNVVAKLRLKDLSDFFTKCPLLKGSTIRFYINTNQTTLVFNKSAGTNSANGIPLTFPLMNVSSVNVIGGLTCPLMVASSHFGQGCYPLPADTYTLRVAIYRGGIQAFQTGLSSCRLYAPVYKMNPLAEQRYLQLAPTKKIEYNDIFQYQFSNNGAGGPFNILVSNGISNIQSVLVIPFLSAGVNMVAPPQAGAGGALVAGISVSSLLSPFSTSGGTPDPITLTNFNILVSGVNLFLNNQLYDYEQFNHELKSSNQLNGNLTTGLASGLISEDMFSRGMRYYYGNCARILPSEEGVSRSIQIQGTNASNVACDLMVFVEFKRSITIDISTGARIE
jgi:hypothetical protein